MIHFLNLGHLYRVGMVVSYTGWVDFEFGHSGQALLWQMGIWQNGLCCWARWWNIQIKVNPTQVTDHPTHRVEDCSTK